MTKSPEAYIAAYEAAMATQQWENVAPMIHDNCTVTFNDGTYVGKPAVEGAFRKTFNLIQDETYRMTNVHWVQKEAESAVLIFIFEWSGIINGEPASGSGRGTSVLTRESGNWQLLSEHLGPLAPKAAGD